MGTLLDELLADIGSDLDVIFRCLISCNITYMPGLG